MLSVVECDSCKFRPITRGSEVNRVFILLTKKSINLFARQTVSSSRDYYIFPESCFSMNTIKLIFNGNKFFEVFIFFVKMPKILQN